MKINYRRLGNFYDEVYKAKTDGHGNYVCLNCGKNLSFDRRRRRFCSNECYNAFYKVHPLILWSNLRIMCFKRDNYKCRNCGGNFEHSSLHCDHIVPIWKGGDDLDLNNLQTLCEKCHRKKTKDESAERTKIGLNILNGIQKQLDTSPSA